MIVDLFAGAGGWDEGLRSIGRTDVVGLEWDAAACQTRAAAGHATIRCDVAAYPTVPFAGRVEGLIASPPCQDFSVAGKRAGLSGVRGRLVYEVLRWVRAVDPLWVACEQVPPVLPVWRLFAAELDKLGYWAWAGIVNAADYGVPQTRRRAFLLAHRDRLRLPEPTHAEHLSPAGLFGGGRLPWVTMAQALGYGGFEAVYHRGAGMTERYGGRPGRSCDQPAPTLTGSALGATLRLVPDRRTNSKDGRGGMAPGVPVAVTRPAPTLTAGGASGQWVWRDSVGYSRPITIGEATILQGFPAGYPWRGSKTRQFEQVGNAVPPPVAAAVVSALAGLSVQAAA